MRTDNNPSLTTRLPLGSRKYYQKPAIWIDELQPLRILDDSDDDPFTDDHGGGANEYQMFGEEEGQGNDNIWDDEE